MLTDTETIHSHYGFLVTAPQFAELEWGFESVKSCAGNPFSRLSFEPRIKSFTCKGLGRGEPDKFIFFCRHSAPLSPADPGLLHFLPSKR